MNGAFKCPKCGTTTWGNLKYCSTCGQSLNITCPECGWSCRYIYADSYKCCPNCGAKMSPALLKNGKKNDTQSFKDIMKGGMSKEKVKNKPLMNTDKKIGSKTRKKYP